MIQAYCMIRRFMSDKATAVEKTLEILLAFETHNQPMGTSELSKKLGYHKATTSRILLTLTEYGFLSQDHETRKFTLGAKVYELGMVLAETSINRIVHVARPHILALRDQLNETIVLEIWSGNRTIAAYTEESKRLLKVAGHVGTPPPVHVTAGAKAILAFAESSQVDAALKGDLERYTENTIVDRKILKARLSEYKELGFATDRDEFDIGISAVGVPIFNHLGTAIAAIVLLTPSAQFTDDPNSEIILALQAAAKKISSKFFYKDSH